MFCKLTTAHDPFDTMRFFEVDAGFVPTGRIVELPLSQALPELAARDADGIRYCDMIDYDE